MIQRKYAGLNTIEIYCLDKKPLNGYFSKPSEDPEEMLYYAAFFQNMHCFLRQNRYPDK